MPHKTTVSIEGDGFCIDGTPTYAGRTWKGRKIEGLLLNSRMVQGIFDDLNDETRPMWDYPDGPWDPERNTAEFVAAMEQWRSYGLLGFTINLQGGSPQGYSKAQPWVNSAFEADGSLRGDYLGRLETILDRADALGMVAIVGYFYFGQLRRIVGEAAVIRAVENATDWIIAKGYRNVLIEISNEVDVYAKKHEEILRPDRVDELVRLVQRRTEGRVNSPDGRLLASASMGGGRLPPAALVEAGDFVLLHGNGVDDPNRIREMVDQCRQMPAYRDQPIVFNEDDHYDFEKEDNNFVAALDRYAGWGFFGYRKEGESLDEGYQCMPCNWGLSSDRKRGFFNLLAEITASTPE